jgi:pSer/pThr/pTyr-binding forkhead associated (FHA) protein
MRDGKTRRREVGAANARGVNGWSATLIELEGGAEGNEYPIAGERIVIGRGPDVDLAFDDEEMSAKHALFEHSRGGLCLTDLDSTNGTRVNGERLTTRVLAHGDRIELGGHVFHLLLEKCEKPPRTWVVDVFDE